MKKALALVAILGASPVFAANSPYYVGENLKAPNHVNLNFQDSPIKEKQTASKAGTNLMAVELKGAYNPMDYLFVRGGLPFYFATKSFTGQKKNAMGNLSLGAGYAWNWQTDDRAWTYGVTATG